MLRTLESPLIARRPDQSILGNKPEYSLKNDAVLKSTTLTPDVLFGSIESPPWCWGRLLRRARGMRWLDRHNGSNGHEYPHPREMVEWQRRVLPQSMGVAEFFQILNFASEQQPVLCQIFSPVPGWLPLALFYLFFAADKSPSHWRRFTKEGLSRQGESRVSHTWDPRGMGMALRLQR